MQGSVRGQLGNWLSYLDCLAARASDRQLQLYKRKQYQRFHTGVTGLNDFVMINIDGMKILAW
jgi:hypothetical protein